MIMGYQEAFAPAAAKYKQDAMANTFGHLAPLKNITYRGKVLFIKSCFESGSLTIVDYQFPDLESSPWLYDAMYDYLYSFEGFTEGAVYTLDCTMRNYRFWGMPKKVLSL